MGAGNEFKSNTNKQGKKPATKIIIMANTNKQGKKPATKRAYKKRVPKVALPKGIKENDGIETPEETERRDKEYNNQLITEAYGNLLIQTQKMPTIAAIAKQTGLSDRTVHRHLKEYDMDNVINKMRAGVEIVMLNLFKQAATSKSEKTMRLYLEAVGLLKKRVDLTSNGKTINQTPSNLVMLDPTQLSNEALQEIIDKHSEQNSD
jgi:DNA-binding transcriptional regulator YhcF (GntR family)